MHGATAEAWPEGGGKPRMALPRSAARYRLLTDARISTLIVVGHRQDSRYQSQIRAKGVARPLRKRSFPPAEIFTVPSCLRGDQKQCSRRWPVLSDKGALEARMREHVRRDNPLMPSSFQPVQALVLATHSSSIPSTPTGTQRGGKGESRAQGRDGVEVPKMGQWQAWRAGPPFSLALRQQVDTSRLMSVDIDQTWVTKPPEEHK